LRLRLNVDLRCGSKKHGVIAEPGFIEIKCDSRFCNTEGNTIVLHVFDASTGKLVKTDRYKNPRDERT